MLFLIKIKSLIYFNVEPSIRADYRINDWVISNMIMKEH